MFIGSGTAEEQRKQENQLQRKILLSPAEFCSMIGPGQQLLHNHNYCRSCDDNLLLHGGLKFPSANSSSIAKPPDHFTPSLERMLHSHASLRPASALSSIMQARPHMDITLAKNFTETPNMPCIRFLTRTVSLHIDIFRC
jgi:hypothetical protein